MHLCAQYFNIPGTELAWRRFAQNLEIYRGDSLRRSFAIDHFNGRFRRRGGGLATCV